MFSMNSILLFRFILPAFLLPTLLPAQSIPDPDPTRFQSAIDKFLTQDKQQLPPDGCIVFAGSSSMRMWPTATLFPDLPVVNRGFGGSQFSDLNHFADQIVFAYKPSIVLVYEGDNDIHAGKTPEQVLEDYQEFARRLHAKHPRAILMYLPVKPSLKRWNRWPVMKKTNDLISTEAGKHNWQEIVDTATPMLGQNGRPRKELFVADGLHLNDAGYKLWSAIVRKAIAAHR